MFQEILADKRRAFVCTGAPCSGQTANRFVKMVYEGVFPGRTHRFCGKAEGEANHAERFFGTIRARLSRLTRRFYFPMQNAWDAIWKPPTCFSPLTTYTL